MAERQALDPTTTTDQTLSLLRRPLWEIEREALALAISECGSLRAASVRLGLARSTVYRKADALGLAVPPRSHRCASSHRKINHEIASEIRALRAAGEGVNAIARRFGVDKSLVSRVCGGERWAEVRHG